MSETKVQIVKLIEVADNLKEIEEFICPLSVEEFMDKNWLTYFYYNKGEENLLFFMKVIDHDGSYRVSTANPYEHVFFLHYYNGGTSLHELIEEELDKYYNK